jgi:XRE family transcriptional regulator, regulator of sulfur utilization
MTRRDVLLGLAACAAASDALADPAQSQAMGSAVYDWNTLTARPTETGSVRSVCNARTATLDELEIHVTTLDPGKSPHPPHRHPNEELVIVKQGEVEAFENGVWTRVGPGSVIFSASNQLHGLRNAGSEPAVYHVIAWKSASMPAAAQS